MDFLSLMYPNFVFYCMLEIFPDRNALTLKTSKQRYILIYNYYDSIIICILCIFMN